jgi:hypothetical protein
MSDEPIVGFDRREFLKKAGIGGAIAWTTPVLSSIRTPALAQTGTPKDFSYVALCYTCDAGLTRCCVKFDLNDDGTVFACEENNFQTPKCPFPFDDTDNNCGNCDLFDVFSPDGGKTIIVSFVPSAPASCHFLLGQGIGKCGNPPLNGECVVATLSLDQRTATFTMCGV